MAAPPTARWIAVGRLNDGSGVTSSSLSMISATSSGNRNEEEMLKPTDISLPLKVTLEIDDFLGIIPSFLYFILHMP